MRVRKGVQALDNIITDESIGPRVDWQGIFGNDRPVQIEIGTGKGRAMLTLARRFDDHNFLGIEWANKFCNDCARRFKHWELDNVRMLRTDAREFVIDRVGAETVHAVHIYFPDPWHKKSQNHHRLVIGEFARALVRILVPGGKVFIATDHADYFEQIETNLTAQTAFRRTDHNEFLGRPLDLDQTNYEAKFVNEGRNIFRLAVEKV